MKSLDQIAAGLQGYDPQAMTCDDVHHFVHQLVTPVTQTVELPLLRTLGKVLASDVESPLDVPPHDNSAMDGYAFAGAQLAPKGTPLVLRVVGTALAGKAWSGTVATGECVKIMTGAIMPSGLDTVVPQELVTTSANSISIPVGVLAAGDNRRLRGEDLARGRAALQKGELLTPARLGLAASLGLKTLTVFRPLRVAYFSTGDEILSLGDAPREGAVFDSNRYTVFGLLTRLGCEVLDLGVVRDDPALLEAAFLDAADRADAIITSGGVSVGEADFTKVLMQQLCDVAFWRIAMRPGRPMAVGRIFKAKSAHDARNTSVSSYENNSKLKDPGDCGAIVFGLPGNPVAVMVTFLAFVRPALLQMMGAKATDQPLLQARSTETIRKKPGRTEYQRVWVSTAADGRLEVCSTGNQGSGVLRSMAEANGLLVLGHTQGNVAVGDTVNVMMFDGAI
jgi:molybdopterin molybdotransferase